MLGQREEERGISCCAKYKCSLEDACVPRLVCPSAQGAFTNDREDSDSIHGWTNLLIDLLFDGTIARVRSREVEPNWRRGLPRKGMFCLRTLPSLPPVYQEVDFPQDPSAMMFLPCQQSKHNGAAKHRLQNSRTVSQWESFLP